ncbi:MAG: zinc-binding dehydrogenase [Cyanobacteria bacterium REEB446]|nr:zinc-binding dehydrogenase [Cyanobacteria bacterium REEB446]
MRSYLYYGPRDIRLEDVTTPDLLDGEVLVKVIYAATGGTDLKTFQRGHPKIIKNIPSSFGYEFIGIIESVGSSVAGFQQGDYVVAANTVPCYECFFCKKAEYSLCENLEFLNGAFAEYIKIPKNIVKHNLYKVSRFDKLEELSLTQTLAVALHGFKRSYIKDDDKVIVYGLGPIGQTFIKLIKFFTKAEVYAVARSQHKLDLAKDNGADFLIDINNLCDEEIKAKLKNLLPYGADVVIEAVGKPEAWQLCLSLVRKGGLINYFGGCVQGTLIQVDTFRLHYDEIKLIGVFHHSPEYIKAALELISEDKICMKNLISQKFSLSDLPKALALHEEGSVLKTLIYSEL